MTTRLVIEGLSDFRRDLRRFSKEAPKALQRANKKTAEAVAPKVQAAYRASKYQQRTGRTAAAIRAVATQTKAGVRIGGARRPYMIGQEFGSNNPKYRQFYPWTGRGPGGKGSRGRYLFPTIRALGPEIADIYWDEMDKEFANPFPLKGFGV